MFFPSGNSSDRSKPANGQQVAENCLNQKVPVILVTSTHHHGEETRPVHRWSQKVGLPLVDYRYQNYESAGYSITCHNHPKNWAGGFLALMYFKELLDNGLVTINCADESEWNDGVYSPCKEYRLSAGQASKNLDLFIASDVNTLRYHVSIDKNPLSMLREKWSKQPYDDPILLKVIDKYCQGLTFTQEEL